MDRIVISHAGGLGSIPRRKPFLTSNRDKKVKSQSNCLSSSSLMQHLKKPKIQKFGITELKGNTTHSGHIALINSSLEKVFTNFLLISNRLFWRPWLKSNNSVSAVPVGVSWIIITKPHPTWTDSLCYLPPTRPDADIYRSLEKSHLNQCIKVESASNKCFPCKVESIIPGTSCWWPLS